MGDVKLVLSLHIKFQPSPIFLSSPFIFSLPSFPPSVDHPFLSSTFLSFPLLRCSFPSTLSYFPSLPSYLQPPLLHALSLLLSLIFFLFLFSFPISFLPLLFFFPPFLSTTFPLSFPQSHPFLPFTFLLFPNSFLSTFPYFPFSPFLSTISPLTTNISRGHKERLIVFTRFIFSHTLQKPCQSIAGLVELLMETLIITFTNTLSHLY